MSTYYIKITVILILIGFQVNAETLINNNNFNLNNSKLLGKKWFIAELIQTKNDSAQNLIGIMHPCEKDNFTQFSADGKYTTYEGKSICKEGDSQIKDEGEWEVDETNSIFYESPSGGKEVEKTIVRLNENEFEIEFPGPDNTSYTIKYLSEESYVHHLANYDKEVQKDSTLHISVQKPHRITITNLVKEVINQSNRYVLVDSSNTNAIPDRKDFQKSVSVLPFTDKALSEEEKKQTLKKASKNTDYLITGNITNTTYDASTQKASVQYKLSLWDVKTQKIINHEIKGIYSPVSTLNKLGSALTAIAVSTYALRYGYRYGYYNRDLARLVAASVENNRNRNNAGLSKYFSELEGDRNELLGKQGKLTRQAILKTKRTVKGFIYNSLPVQFSILEISKTKKDGAPKQILIAGGSDSELKALQNMQVVLLKQSTSANNTPTIEREVLANLLIGSIDGKTQAKCRVTKLFKDFTGLLNNDTGKVVVETKMKN